MLAGTRGLEVVAMRWRAVVMALLVWVQGCDRAEEHELSAPQAELMARVAEGVLGGEAGLDVGRMGETFVDMLARGNFSTAVSVLDEEMEKALPEAELEKVWKQQEARAGAFVRRVGTSTERRGKLGAALVKCRFERGSVTVRVVFEGRKVTGLFFLPAGSGEVRARGEAFVDLLGSGDFDGAFAMFDESMKKSLPADKLELVWKSVVARHGEYKKRLRAQETWHDKYDIALVTCELERKNVVVKVVFEQDRVTGLFFFPEKGDNEQIYQAP